MARLATHRLTAHRALGHWLGLHRRPFVAFDRWATETPFREVGGGLCLLYFGVVLLPAVVVAEALGGPRPWQEDLAATLLCLYALAWGRVALLRASWGRVSLREMGNVQRWMAASPRLTRAASSWMSPGLELRRGDYWAIRRASRVEQRFQGRDAPEDTAQLGGVGRWLADWDARVVAWLVREGSPSTWRRRRQERQCPESMWAHAHAMGVAWLLEERRRGVGPLSPEEIRALDAPLRWRTAQAATPGSGTAGLQATWVRRVWQPSGWDERNKEGRGVGAAWAWSVGGSALAVGVFGTVGVWMVAEALKVAGEGWGWAAERLAWMGHPEEAAALIAWATEHQAHGVWVGLAAAGVVAVASGLREASLARLRTAWWSLPLSDRGLEALRRLVATRPAVRAAVLTGAGVGLTQADLGLARRAEKALRAIHRAHLDVEDGERRAAALEALPSMQAYRARAQAERLEATLDAGVPVAPRRPRL